MAGTGKRDEAGRDVESRKDPPPRPPLILPPRALNIGIEKSPPPRLFLPLCGRRKREVLIASFSLSFSSLWHFHHSIPPKAKPSSQSKVAKGLARSPQGPPQLQSIYPPAIVSQLVYKRKRSYEKSDDHRGPPCSKRLLSERDCEFLRDKFLLLFIADFDGTTTKEGSASALPRPIIIT